MKIDEVGVLPQSKRYFFTPSTFARRVLLYPTRVGHYFCDREYHFSFRSETALKESHRMNFMLLLVRNGALELRYDGRCDTVGNQQLALFDCRQPHEYRTLSKQVEFHWLLFNGLQAEAMYQEILSLRDRRHVFKAAEPDQVQLAVRKILTGAEEGLRIREQVFSETIYTLLCQLLTIGGSEEKSDGLIERALNYIDRNVTSELTVSAVASQVGLSSSYFTKQFRAVTGYSPYEYLILRRIDLAKSLLLTGDLTVGQIAFEAGYQSEENFIRSFKKTVGVSPSTFRKYPV